VICRPGTPRRRRPLRTTPCPEPRAEAHDRLGARCPLAAGNLHSRQLDPAASGLRRLRHVQPRRCRRRRSRGQPQALENRSRSLRWMDGGKHDEPTAAPHDLAGPTEIEIDRDRQPDLDRFAVEGPRFEPPSADRSLRPPRRTGSVPGRCSPPNVSIPVDPAAHLDPGFGCRSPESHPRSRTARPTSRKDDRPGFLHRGRRGERRSWSVRTRPRSPEIEPRVNELRGRQVEDQLVGRRSGAWRHS